MNFAQRVIEKRIHPSQKKPRCKDAPGLEIIGFDSA
jgi:hypothetical protein